MPQGTSDERTGLNEFLVKIIERYSDIKSVVICSPEGNILTSVGRTSRMDENMSSKLVSSFTVSCDQSSRLNLGKVEHSILWSAGAITVQFKLELVVVSIELEENANLGVMDEFIPVIRKTLLPFCTSLS